MQLEDYFDFLAPNDIRIKDHRIGIETILYEYLFRVRTPEEINQSYPSLTLEEIYATILYYIHNKETISNYIEDWRFVGTSAAQKASPKFSPSRCLTAEVESRARSKFDQ